MPSCRMKSQQKRKRVKEKMKEEGEAADRKISTATHYEHSKASLKKWPADIGDKSSEILFIDVSWNNIKDIPDGALRRVLKLEELDISYNGLQVLPEEISVLNRLKILDLQSNLLAFLPQSFEQLNVEELYLANNQVCPLPFRHILTVTLAL